MHPADDEPQSLPERIDSARVAAAAALVRKTVYHLEELAYLAVCEVHCHAPLSAFPFSPTGHYHGMTAVKSSSEYPHSFAQYQIAHELT